MPSPSMLVLPMTLRPVSPPGISRRSSRSTLTPGSSRLEIWSPSAASTWRATYTNPRCLLSISASRSETFSSGRLEEVVERLDRGGAVLDELRVDRDGGGGHGDRQLVAVAVEDRAALRGHVPRAGPLRGALLAVGVGLGGLQCRDAGDHDHQQDRDDDQRGDQRKRGEPARRGARLRGGGAWTRTRLRGGCLRAFDREPAFAGCRAATCSSLPAWRLDGADRFAGAERFAGAVPDLADDGAWRARGAAERAGPPP